MKEEWGLETVGGSTFMLKNLRALFELLCSEFARKFFVFNKC